jgi:anti-sigma factor RsiW
MSHELGDKQSWLVHEHLLHCEECRREAASIEATLELLRSDTSVVVPEHLPNTIRRRLERAILHPVLDWIYEHRRLVAWVMAIGIIALLAFLAGKYSKTKPEGTPFWINIMGRVAAETRP